MGNGGSNPETGHEDAESLKRMRERVNWENQVERHELYRQFCGLIRDWQGRLPNLREIFGREEIDWLLEECVDTGPVEFINFVAKTGYRDEPDLDKDGLRRNTPVHYAIDSGARDWFSKISALFKIYDRYYVNYTSESGLTHFHVACMIGHKDAVEKFLEHGYDPNCLVPVKNHTPLHYSVYLKRNQVSELLLRRGANPNLANYRGLTPLHLMCSSCDDFDLAELLLEISHDMKYPPMPIDALDNNGETPLIMALQSGNMRMVESLLRSGADPNLAAAGGFTPLHLICSRNVDDDTAEVFLRINEDMRQKVKVDAVNEWGRTPLWDAVRIGARNKVEALLRRGANPNLASPQAGQLTPLHIIALRAAEDGFMDEFFEMCGRWGPRLEVDALDQWNQTPLLLALHYGHRRSAESLLRHGANPSIANCRGSQPLHVIGRRSVDDDLAETFLRIIDDLRQQVEIDARDQWGWTPLLHALRYGTMRTVEVLLRRGADPNAANKNGSRALHIICRSEGDDDLLEAFLRITDDIQRTVEIDARGRNGVTPLHYALCHGLPRTAENLLRRGADPNIPDDAGATALHYISGRETDDDELAKRFFETCDDIRRQVQLNAPDDLGRTPLHRALDYGNRMVAKFLLERGADPASIDTKGSTPLHVVCQRDDDDDDLVDVFFEVCYDQFKMVQVDARDNEGRTPLQTAVANLLPNVVDVLLDRHASLCGFSFPATNRFRRIFDESNRDKLSLASGALVIVERLEERGYDMSRSDVLTIVQLFLKYGLFEESSDLEKYWCDEEEFMSKATEIMIIPNSLSLFELLFLRPEEAEKLLTYTDYFEIERSNDLDDIPEQYRDLCSRHLCEKMSRGYFQRLALDAFQELTQYRLPILCSEMIIDNLMNEDLLRIYEAGEIHD